MPRLAPPGRAVPRLAPPGRAPPGLAVPSLASPCLAKPRRAPPGRAKPRHALPGHARPSRVHNSILNCSTSYLPKNGRNVPTPSIPPIVSACRKFSSEQYLFSMYSIVN